MDGFFDSVVKIIEAARHHVRKTIDITMCISYYEIGRMIVEEEQCGEHRAKYGAGLLKELSVYLTEKFGRGYSVSNLMNFRQFFIVYFPIVTKYQSPISISNQGQQIDTSVSNNSKIEIYQSLISKFEDTTVLRTIYPFRVSWTHYLILMRIENDQERSFYEIEAQNEGWSVRQLQRQYHSSLYERLLLSRDKDEVMRLAKDGQKIEKPGDISRRDYLKNLIST